LSDHRDATPPMISEVNVGAVFLGAEEVTVRAGAHPPYDIWAEEQDGVFLKGGVGGYMQTWYELIALDR
jgi:hypothetical protein